MWLCAVLLPQIANDKVSDRAVFGRKLTTTSVEGRTQSTPEAWRRTRLLAYVTS